MYVVSGHVDSFRPKLSQIILPVSIMATHHVINTKSYETGFMGMTFSSKVFPVTGSDSSGDLWDMVE